jgi:DNA-binding MarR family transcriptional regulator
MAVETVPDDRLSLEQQICFTLAVASRDVVSLYRPFLEPLGLTHPQYLLMVTLWENPQPLCVKDLSALLKVDAPTLSPLLKRMETAGLLSRERNPADERSVLITLTPRGQELRSRAGTVPASIIQRLGMSIEELELLQSALQNLIGHANVRSSSSSGPAPAEV